MKRLSLTLMALLFPLRAIAQSPATGFPPYGSFEQGSFDAVNRQNLNVNFGIPIVFSPGRGQDYKFAITYDSLIWQRYGSYWTSVTDPNGNPTFGWKTNSGVGTVWFSWAREQCDAPQPEYTNHYAGYRYTDIAGTVHTFAVDFYEFATVCQFRTGPRTGYASDGTGLYIDATIPTQPLVQMNSGFSINGPALKDTNGNFFSGTVVSPSETDWKDTVGRIALKIQNLTGIANCGTNIPQCIQYKYPDSNGTDQTIQLNFQTFNINPNFQCPGVVDPTMTANLPVSTVLANGKSYRFSYEPTPNMSGYITGRLQQVTLPTGGYYKYEYPGANGGINCSDGTVTNLTRTISDGTTSAQWTFARAQNGPNWTTTETAPQLPYDSAANQTVFTFDSNGHETSRAIYQGSASGTPLRTMNTAWAANGTPSSQTVILEDTQQTQSQVETTFDSYGNLQLMKEHDWGTGTPGPVSRTTTYTYSTDTAYTSRNILNRVTRVTVADSTGAIKSRTDIAYDEATYINTLPCPTGVPQHDDTNYSCTFTTRGNPTTLTKYTDPVTPAGGFAQHTSYDFFGNAVKADVNCCQQEQWVYSTATNYAYPDSVVRGPSGNQLTSSATYNSYTGLLASSTDENNQVTSYSYDLMKRLTDVRRPDNQHITYAYDDTARTVTVGTPIQGSNVQKQITSFDGLGRPFLTTITDGATTPTTYSITGTQYDPLGRPYMTSNPYTGVSASYWTTTQFDALGRTVLTILPDNSQALSSYSTNTVTTTDLAGKKRKSQTDGLGRLVAVFEPDVTTAGNPLTQQTTYSYNVLDALTQVSQDVQRRTYNYDALGRLSSAATPETNNQQVIYQYDPVFYTLVTQRTDARGVITNYTYDTLNRPKQTSYNVGATGVPATPTITLTYGTDPTKNNNGRLLTMTDGVGSETYTFDPHLPLVTQVQKVMSGTTYTTGYGYNLAGELTSTTYPSGRLVQNSYDAVGRLATVSDTMGSTNTTYASGFGYNVAQQVTGFNYGNGVAASFGYSADRLQMTSLSYAKGAQTLFGLNYWYKQDATNCVNGAAGNNGQIQCITDSVDSGRSVGYTYDALYRLTSAITTGSINYPKWGLSWSYDRYANRLAQTVTAGTGPPNSVTVDPITNRVSGYTYDANGNLTVEPMTPLPPNNYSYDGESRLVSFQGGSSSATYSYDGNNRRVQKVSGGTTTVYVFSGTKVIAEYAPGAAVTAPTREYIYSGSQLLATIAGSSTTYHHADHLSVRVTTDPNGTKIGEQAHYPYGESWYASSTTTKWQFTSYERDAESGNDYAMARYHVNRLGRFSSPDPIAGSAADPQSLNRYAYVLNDPINLTDPLGLLPDLPEIAGNQFDSAAFLYWLFLTEQVGYCPAEFSFCLGTLNGIIGFNGADAVVCTFRKRTEPRDPVELECEDKIDIGLDLTLAQRMRVAGGGGTDQKAKLKELLKNPDCAALLGGADRANKLVDRMSVVPAANAQPVPGSDDFNAWNLLRASGAGAYASTAPYSRTGVVFTSTKFDALKPPAQSTVLFHELEHHAFGRYGEPDRDRYPAEYSGYIRDRYREISKKCGTAVPK